MVAIEQKISSEPKLRLLSTFGDNWVELTIPVVTVSEANGGAKRAIKRNGKTIYKAEHWSDKHSRHKKQKALVFLLLRPLRHLLSVPCHITFTRFAPNKLDRFENLPMSMKYIMDAVCAVIKNDYRPGRADDDERITASCNQVFSDEYGVRIRIEVLPQSLAFSSRCASS